MKQSKLVRILEKLWAAPPATEPEATAVARLPGRELRVFLISPFFNTNEQVVRLYDFLARFAPNFEEQEIKEEKAFGDLFPGEPFDEGKLRRLRSKLLKLLETYLHVQGSLASEFQRDLTLLRFFDEKNLLHEFDLLASQMEQSHLERENLDSGFFLELFRMEDAISRMKSGKADNFVEDVNFQVASDSLDLFYLVQKLMYSCLMLNRSKVLNSDKPFHYGLLPLFIEDMEPVSERHGGYAPVLQIWLAAYRLLLATDAAAMQLPYEALKTGVFELEERLSLPDLCLLTTILLNSVKNIFPDRAERYAEQFGWYRFLVEKKAYLHGAVLTPGMFKNIVTLALLMNMPDWAEDFIENYRHLLPATDNSLDLCRAMLHFERTEFRQALDLLEGPESAKQEVVYNVAIERRIRLKIFYDDRNDERFDALHVSFSTWLSRNKSQLNKDYLAANRAF